MPVPFEAPTARPSCVRCRRPASVCWCAELTPVETATQVVFLQHPRESRVAIGTARIAHLGLSRSELHEGIEFAGHPRIEELLGAVKTLVWNGPFGAFELTPFDAGTNAVARVAAGLTDSGKLLTVAGGGDTVSALNQAGVGEHFTYISTAGGAFLEWLEGKPLPGVEALNV